MLSFGYMLALGIYVKSLSPLSITLSLSYRIETQPDDRYDARGRTQMHEQRHTYHNDDFYKFSAILRLKLCDTQSRNNHTESLHQGSTSSSSITNRGSCLLPSTTMKCLYYWCLFEVYTSNEARRHFFFSFDNRMASFVKSRE